jgi:hypothetical protein
MALDEQAERILVAVARPSKDGRIVRLHLGD